MRRGLSFYKALHRSKLMWGVAVWLAAATLSPALPTAQAIAQEKKEGTVLRVPPGSKLRASLSGISAEATVTKPETTEPLLTAVALDDWNGYVRDFERSRPFSTGTSISDSPKKLLIVAGDSLKDVIPTILADFSLRKFSVHKHGSDYIEDPWYYVVATSSQPGGTGSVPLDRLWSNAWLRLSETSGIPPQELQKKPAMLMVATYMLGELPGVKRYSISERAGSSFHEGSWLLEKGALRGQIRFVREAGDAEFETIKTGILGERRVHVEIEFEVPPSLESIDVEIGRNGQIQKLGGPDKPPYLRLSGPYLSRSKAWNDPPTVPRLGMTALPDPRREIRGIPQWPRVYRSEPIVLWDANRAGAPEGNLITVRPGDKVQAQLADLSIGNIAPRVGSILVKHQPDLEWTWPVALARAAKALGRGVGDLKKSSREEIAQLSNSTITSGTWTTTVRLGDLAAMLLLRDRFLQMMRDYLKEARQIDNPRALYGFRKLVEPSIWDETNPLGLVEVLDPASLIGRKLKYAEVIKPGYLRGYFSSRIGAESFLQAKTREALDSYLEAVESSLAQAEPESLRDNDIAGLLKLTSASFDAVVESLLPELMAPLVDTNSGDVRWEPDMVARGHVKGIANLGAQLRAQNQLAEADKNVVLAVASLPLVVAPASLLTTILSLALGAVDVVDAASNLALDEQDSNFAMGSSAVLGMDSINMAELQRTPLWANVLSMVGAAIGIKADVLQAVGKVNLTAAISRADSLLSRMKQGDWRAFKEMSASDQAEIIALVGEATLAARKNPAKLTPLQRQLLDAGERLLKDAESSQVATRALHGPTGTSIAPRPPSAGGARPAEAGGDFAADLRTPEGRAALDREIADQARLRERGAASGATAPSPGSGAGDLFGRPGFRDLPSKPRAEGPELESFMTPKERADLEARARAETQPLPAAKPPVTGPTGTSIAPRPPSAGGARPAEAGGDFAADLRTPEGRAALDREIADQARLREREAASGATAPSPGSGAGDLFGRPGFRDLPSKPRAEGPDLESFMTPKERADLEARARAETQPLPAAKPPVTGSTGTSVIQPATPRGGPSGIAPLANELLENLRGADPRLSKLDVEAARKFIQDNASRPGATPESLLVEAARAQGLNVNPRLLSEAAGIDFSRARDLVTEGRPRTATAEPPRVSERPSVTPETPPASLRPSFVPERNQTLHEIIDALFGGGDRAPPLHVTDRAGLEHIANLKSLEQPARGGASWSPPGLGTLREGNVAIRIKPGHEPYIEFRRDPNGTGLVPLHWPSGKRGVGRVTTYIPTDRLQWLDPGRGPGQERWVNFTPASKR